MLTRVCALLFVAMLAFTQLHSASAAEADEKAAVDASKSWLALIDDGKYRESWKQAAQYFKGAVKQQQWEQQIRGVRAPLGKVIDRKLKSKQYATRLPGAPDGEYVVIQYDTNFSGKAGAVETITPMKQPSGEWRVSGYFIK